MNRIQFLRHVAHASPSRKTTIYGVNHIHFFLDCLVPPAIFADDTKLYVAQSSDPLSPLSLALYVVANLAALFKNAEQYPLGMTLPTFLTL